MLVMLVMLLEELEAAGAVGTTSSVACPSPMAVSRRRFGRLCCVRRPGVYGRNWRLLDASALAGLNLEIGWTRVSNELDGSTHTSDFCSDNLITITATAG